MARDRFLAATATITLAVCIGANTAVFSVADSILIRPLPYPAAGRIDWISERSGPAHEEIAVAPDYYRIREQNQIFEEVAAFNPITVNWTGTDRPEQLDAAAVTPSFFQVMGMPPRMGRYFGTGESGPKAPPIAVLSYDFWRNRMGGDPQVLGKTISFDRLPRTIAGVMPQGFDFPHGTQVWVPSQLDESQRQLSPSQPIFIVSIIARRKPGITPQQAETEMNRLTFAVRSAYPKQLQARGFRTDLMISAAPLQEHLTGQLRPAILVLSGAVGLVLVIACVNLANLLLARSGTRRRELAVRMALGSGRARIMRQMLEESLLLALPGGIAGIALAWIAVRALDSAKPAILARYPEISTDWRVLAFSVAVTIATSLLFGIAPALSAAGIQIQEALKSAGPTYSAGRAARRLRKGLMVAELAVSLVLLIGAGLLARSFLNLAHTDLGFRADHLLTFRVNPIGSFDQEYSSFHRSVLERVQVLPSVRSASLVDAIPLKDDEFRATGRVRVVGHSMVPFVERPLIMNSVVSAEFFQTLGIPLKSGRLFDAHDFARSPAPLAVGYVQSEPVVVNEALVRRILPGEDPLGRRLVFGPDERNITWTVVGVVGDTRGGALGGDPPALVYRCTCAGSPLYSAGFLVRTAGDPKAVVRAIEQQVRTVDRDQPIVDVKTMDERRDAALAPGRFQLILIGTFAGIALLLAAAGVYGIMSYLVARRTREIGIRVAMGARPKDVLRMVIGETTMLVAVAISVGLASASALTRYLQSMLYGVTAVDRVTFELTPVLLAAIVLMASVAPARRAVRVDPLTALREE